MRERGELHPLDHNDPHQLAPDTGYLGKSNKEIPLVIFNPRITGEGEI